jgi:predicted permease
MAVIVDATRDVRYAARALRKNPAFATTAILTLAIGIGATTAAFSLVYGVLMRPLPYAESDRLVRVWEEHPGGTVAAGSERWLSNRVQAAWTPSARTLDALGGFATYEYAVLFGERSSRLFGTEISPAILPLLGPRRLIGRLFTPEDGREGAAAVALIGESLWREAYSAASDILSRSLILDGRSYAIVGVVASDFYFPDRRARFWLPHQIPPVPTDSTNPNTRAFSAVGRLAAGVSPSQAEAEGTAIARTVPVTMTTELLFGKGGPPVVHVRRFVDDISVTVRPALVALTAAVCLVLLIGCANVANLLLARGVSRQRELTVRAAIGASRWRLVRQLLVESLVLAAAGGSVGFGLAAALIRVAPAVMPSAFPRIEDVRVDGRMLAFAIGASVAAAVLAGLAPGLRGARSDACESLRGGDGSSTTGYRSPRARRLRDALLITEAAFAVVLVVAAALVGRSFARLVQVDAGYDAEHVTTVRAQIFGDRLPERSMALIDRVLARVRSMPGVVAAGAGNMMPLAALTSVTTMTLPPGTGGTQPMLARSTTYSITPGYAEALGLRLRDGRLFTDSDAGAGVRSMMVNDEFARQYLTGGRAVGQRFANLLNVPGITEVVGRVGNVLKDGNDRAPQPESYFPLNPSRGIRGPIHFVIRTTASSTLDASTVRSVIREADPTATIDRLEPLSAAVSTSFAQPRFATAVFVSFAALALMLAAIGLYGVLSYAVSQSRRELGIRSALGASSGHLTRQVLREGLTVTATGLLIGVGLAAALTSFIRDILFGVSPLDPLSFAVAPIALFVVATLACVRPARHAATVAPAEALKSE